MDKPHVVQNANEIHRSRLSALDKIALIVTEKVGTLGFFLIILFWTLVWLVWNTFGPSSSRFDPYPAFVLWLFISNLIQIHLMPLIMIGQNIQARHANIRAEQEYHTTLHTDHQIKALEEQLAQILKRLDSSVH